MATPYDVLGIDADADEAAVVRAYRQRVKEAHPDHGGSLAEFERVRRAYEPLSAERDPETFEADADDRAGETESPDGSDAEGADADQADSGEEADDERTLGPTVEYLDYAVVEAHNWELSDEDLFEKAEAADLDVDRYGLLVMEDRETILEAAERYGFSWPYACRGGACANCAVAVVEGEVEMPVSTVLTEEMRAQGVRLSCIAEPVTDDLKVVFNIERLPGLAELRLPAEGFESAGTGD
mgnify:CR=1 FL=1